VGSPSGTDLRLALNYLTRIGGGELFC